MVNKVIYIEAKIEKNVLMMKLAAIGDILAIPGFLALVIYFSQIQNKNAYEVILLCFSSAGLIADVFFTLLELTKERKEEPPWQRV